MAKIRIAFPETAAKDEVIQIRTLISHPMDNGYHYTNAGTLIPRNIIDRFTVTYNGVAVFQANMQPAQATNPYVVFHTVAVESGTLEFTWYDDDGSIYKESRDITVQ